MAPSINKVETGLINGKIGLSELLSLRRELNRPFISHPLGFFACPLLVEGDRKLRLHFWPEKGGRPQSSQCQIHDHLFQFRSWVMVGSVENIEYAVSAIGQDFSVYRTEYFENRSTLIKTDKLFKISELTRRTFGAGSSYFVQAGALHKTERVGDGPAFTVLVTTDILKNMPLVLGPIDGLDRHVSEREPLDDTVVETKLAKLCALQPAGSLRAL